MAVLVVMSGLLSHSMSWNGSSRSMYSVRKVEYDGSSISGNCKDILVDPFTPNARSAVRTLAGELIGRS